MSLGALGPFNNIPVLVYGVPESDVQVLTNVIVGFGLHVRSIDSFDSLSQAISDKPNALVFFALGRNEFGQLDELIALEKVLDPRQTALVAYIDNCLDPEAQSECLGSGLVSDLLVSVDDIMLVKQKCRLYLELLQRRSMQNKEASLIDRMVYQREQLLSSLSEGVLTVTAEGYITDLNEFAIEVLGYGRESLVGGHISQLLCASSSEDPLLDWCEHPIYSAMITQQFTELDSCDLWRSDGEVLPVHCKVRAMYPGAQSGFMLVFQDLSVRKVEEAQLDQLTRYDPVTGLANISLMRHFLLKAMARALRNDRRLAVLYVDLDDFRCINENFGSGVGDTLLRSVGRCLKNCIRTGDLVSRCQNDEFIVVLDEVKRTVDVEKVAQQMLEKLNTPHDLNGVPVVCHASIGIAFYPHGSIGLDKLIDHAMEAMKWVKLNGKNSHNVFGRDKLTAASMPNQAAVH